MKFEVGQLVRIKDVYVDEILSNPYYGEEVRKFCNKQLKVKSVGENSLAPIKCEIINNGGIRYFTERTLEVDIVYYRKLKLKKILCYPKIV